TFLAVSSPVLIAPAMNTNMWKNAATQHNVAVLRGRGCHFIGPASGRLACGDDDVGRMSEPAEIAQAIAGLLTAADTASPRDLTGRRVLVTAGPTREPIDPVRYLTNHSSGKMGYAIARAAARRGADAVLVSGPTSLTPPAGVEFVPIETTEQLRQAVVSRAPSCDAVIQAAAPSDFRPFEALDRKIKRTGGELALRLIPNPDIAAQLGREKRAGQVLVAFAAETDDLIANARKKLAAKNADLVVANDVTQPGAGFGVDTNRVTLVSAAGERALPLMDKAAVADAILDEVAALLSRAPR
ncbi:MAG: bifunctional phosphopantothenoylcysteine decarboxylase/phosphopantothenate--cysteine ligase CoaBC, partial [Clostridiales bacterium]|nr:bifunctional phosphopantothenoylcysteine decarboxylase/phosphopantothenate--cysteine ligase CoaBC [Clostridiales bacterium]